MAHDWVVRFYLLPVQDEKTACVNFDHVANILVGAETIEIYFIGQETPMIVPKTPVTKSIIAKGMDLSENVKETVNAL